MKTVYGIAIVLGYILTFFACGSAYEDRGYFGYGGEWLIFPMCIIIASLIDELYREHKRGKRRNEKNREILPKE